MPAEWLLREVARRTQWSTIEGLWTEALNPKRFKHRPPAPATPPDPPAPFILYDVPVVFTRDGEPMLVEFRAPKYAPPPPAFSTRTSSPSPTPPPPPSPTPSPPPPPIPDSVTDHAPHVSIHSAPPPPISSSRVSTHFDEFMARAWGKVMEFNWKKGCCIGVALLSVFVMWRCYRGWANPGGGQRDGPNPWARVHSRGVADVLLAYDSVRPCKALPANLPMTREFAGMVKVGEAMFGPYAWERFDLLVFPPSFSHGCLEKPIMIFLAPAKTNGDGAGAQMVAHELPQTWTSNLITNSTHQLPQTLNEGFTMYAEKRIVEVVQGDEQAALNMGLGWRGLNRMMDRFNNNMVTRLEPEMAGIDPDNVLLWCIKNLIGRRAFDEFLKKYIVTFMLQSIDKETLIGFLKANVPGIENQIDLDLWIEGTDLPSDAMEPDSATYRKICTLAAEFKSGKIPNEDEVADWSGQEWELYLENLSTDVEASQFAQVTALDERYNLSKSHYYEVKVAFLQLAIPMGCRCYFNGMEKWLKIVGRMKYLRLNRQGSNST